MRWLENGIADMFYLELIEFLLRKKEGIYEYKCKNTFVIMKNGSSKNNDHITIIYEENIIEEFSVYILPELIKIMKCENSKYKINSAFLKMKELIYEMNKCMMKGNE